MADSKYPTIGGVLTRGEVYIKIIHMMDELMDLLAMMAHLHQTENNGMDTLLAKGWLGMVEMFKMIRIKITELAKGSIQ